MSAAIVFDAPGLLSTTNGCFSESASSLPSMRATMSVPPPGDAPTIIFTGLDGQDCAAAGKANAIAAAASSSNAARRFNACP